MPRATPHQRSTSAASLRTVGAGGAAGSARQGRAGTMRAMISGRIPHEVVARGRSVDPPTRWQTGARRARVGAGAGLPALDQGGPMKRSRWIALTAAALAVALVTTGTAAGASRHHPGDAYTVHAARLRPGRRRADDRSEPRQRLGHLGRPGDAVVGREQRHRTPRRSTTGGTRFPPPPTARSSSASRALRPARSSTAARSCSVSNGTTMVPAKFIFATEARHDPGLAARHGRDRHRRRRLQVGRGLQGPRDRRRLALRDRLPRTAASTSSTATGSPSSCRARSPTRSCPSGYAPFGIQNLGGNIFVTYAKQQTGSTDEADGTGLGIVDEYSRDGRLHGPRRDVRRAERAVGPRLGARDGLRQGARARCSSATSATATSTSSARTSTVAGRSPAGCSRARASRS